MRARLVAAVGAVALAGAAWAHGPKAHAHQAHMQAVKGRVPAALKNLKAPPTPATEASLARAGEVYQRHCASCHGPEGRGDGPLAGVMPHPPANFLDLAHSATYGPGEKYWVITHGAPETGMPGFEAELAEGERWGLVHWILRAQVGGR